MCLDIVLGNLVRRWPHSSLKMQWEIWNQDTSLVLWRQQLNKAHCLSDFSSHSFLHCLSWGLTPGTFWPLLICQIFSLLHLKFFLNSLTCFLITRGPCLPTVKLPHSGEKARQPVHMLCNHPTKPRRWATMHGDLADDYLKSGQEHLALCCASFFFFWDGLHYLKQDTPELALEKAEAQREQEQHPIFQKSQL